MVENKIRIAYLCFFQTLFFHKTNTVLTFCEKSVHIHPANNFVIILKNVKKAIYILNDGTKEFYTFH